MRVRRNGGSCGFAGATVVWSLIVVRIRFAANDALKPHHFHRPSHSVACDIEVFSLQMSPHFSQAVDLEVLVEHPAYLDFHGNIIPFADR